jgi:hypothetical protein
MQWKFIPLFMLITASVMAAQQSRETLTNASIIRMKTMGLPEEMIIRAIGDSPGAYDTSVDGFLLLKRAEVSEDVIAAIVEKATTTDSLKQSAAKPSPRDTRSPLSYPTTHVTGSSSGTKLSNDIRAPNSLVPTAHSGGSDYDRAKGSKPRVFLRAKSHSDSWTAGRNQSMEMSKDFGDVCPGIKVSVSHELSDYTVSLNHTEHGFYRDNQVQVVNRAGDIISGTREGGSIKSRVKDACADIVADWEGDR